MVTRAVLLAAGEGRRLRPLTETLPKCLVPIRGTPLLALWFALLERHGITDVLVNQHHAHERVSQFVAGHATRLRVRLVHEPDLLGSAGTVLANRQFVQGHDSFLIAYADNLTNMNLTHLIRFHHHHTAMMTVAVVPTDTPWLKGTVMLDRRGHIVKFEEKATHSTSTLANAGVYVARQSAIDMLEATAPTSGVFDFGLHVLPNAVPDLVAYQVGDFLMDIGTPEDYERGQRTWPGLPDEVTAGLA